MHTFSVHALPSSHWALMEHAVGAGVGAAVEQALPAWVTQRTASPVDVLIDLTLTVISTPLIFSVQLPPELSLARRYDCAPPVPSLPARVIMTSTEETMAKVRMYVKENKQ